MAFPSARDSLEASERNREGKKRRSQEKFRQDTEKAIMRARAEGSTYCYVLLRPYGYDEEGCGMPEFVEELVRLRYKVVSAFGMMTISWGEAK